MIRNVCRNFYEVDNLVGEHENLEQAMEAAKEYIFGRILNGYHTRDLPIYACYLERHFDANGILVSEKTQRQRVEIVTEEYTFDPLTDHTDWDTYLWYKIYELDYIDIGRQREAESWIGNIKRLGFITNAEADGLLWYIQERMKEPVLVDGDFSKGNKIQFVLNGSFGERIVQQKKVDSEPYIVVGGTEYYKKEFGERSIA